jgi:multiple sugar transport system ATP-binding protein
MADKIVVMHDGRIEQMGAPLALYDKPGNRFVAGFIGSPAMNFLQGRIANRAFVSRDGWQWPLDSGIAAPDGTEVTLGIRPEHLTLGEGGMSAEVVVVEPTGPEVQVNARLAGGEEIVAMFRERHLFKPGEKISLKPQPGLVHLFDGATGKRL